MSYVNRIKAVINSSLSQMQAEGWFGQPIENKEIFLRPPKDESRGDLSTNVAMVVAAKSGRELTEAAEIFLDSLHGIDAVFAAELTEKGYINIEVAPDYLARELARILVDYDKFSPTNAVKRLECILPLPAATPDLISARVRLNSDCLRRIADGYDLACKTQPWRSDAETGFSYEAALAKCSEFMTHIFLLDNRRALGGDFSPQQVIDRSYDNPGFAIPYAYARINRLIARSLEGKDPLSLEDLAAAACGALYTDIAEKRLIKHVSQWHLVVEQIFLAGDAQGLVSYLKHLSRLFFALHDSNRLVSGNYLKSSDDKLARLGLITAISMVLAKGLELLGLEAEAEVR